MTDHDEMNDLCECGHIQANHDHDKKTGTRIECAVKDCDCKQYKSNDVKSQKDD